MEMGWSQSLGLLNSSLIHLGDGLETRGFAPLQGLLAVTQRIVFGRVSNDI